LGDRGTAPTETLRLPVFELKIGSIFAARYQVIEELGRGGMGQVYRVLDAKLKEEIALKVIRPDIAPDRDAIERFRTELKAARQIVHRNVARMFDLNEENGVPYITMEYVKGENLRRLLNKVGLLSPKQAVPIAKQVCEGLAEAHRMGVIHRDLKPQNIMIDEEGRARIMDFGLARLVKSEGLTEKGMLFGTPAYMSPEQVDGLPVDSRSDLYSLGIILYEMVTGQVPFQGDSPLSTALKHKTEKPRDPREICREVSEGLARMILRLLGKDRAKRYQSAEELLVDLDKLEKDLGTGKIHQPVATTYWSRVWRPVRSLLTPRNLIVTAVFAVAVIVIAIIFPSPNRASGIAVLPVEDLGSSEKQVSLCKGLQVDIIRKLNSIPELRVLPELSTSNYDPKGKDVPQIGQELGVRYLLKLSLRVEEDTLRVNADIYDAKRNVNEQPLYKDYSLKNFFDIEDEISRYIARILKSQLLEQRLRTIKRREPKNLEAYYYFLEGMRLVEESDNAEDLEEAIRAYQKAIAIEPQYALAYWELGNAYEAYYNMDSGPKDPANLDRMLQNYQEAYRISPDFAETNLGLGWAYFSRGDNDTAFPFFKKAVELDSGNLMVNYDVGAFLRSIGLDGKALKYLRKAVKLDPLYVPGLILISACQMNLGEFEQAAREVEIAIAKNPRDFSGRIYHAIYLALLNRPAEAEKEIEAAREIKPDSKQIPDVQALVWAVKGEKEKALAYLESHEILTIEGTAIYLSLGRKDEAIRNIEAGIERGFQVHGWHPYSYSCLSKRPYANLLKGEPRFRRILEQQKRKFEEMLDKSKGL